MKDKRLSVLLITNQLIYGGAERYTVSVANELIKRGSKVAVVSRGGPMHKLLNKKVKVYFAPVRKTDMFNRLRTVLTIIYVCWKEKVQLIHTQSTSGAFAARIAKIFTRTPVIKTAHGYPEGRFPSVARTLNFTTDKVVMISSWLSRRLISFGLRKEKAKTILNGIDINKFENVRVNKEKLRKKLGLTEKDKVLISVSRVVPEKQFEKLIYWFPYVLAKVPQAKLLIVGNGGADGEGYRDELIKHTKQADLEKSIFFINGTDKVQEILSIADVFCTPSVGKGFAVLEAMTSGLPVVARKPRGAVDTVQDGVNGFLFSSSDWRSMGDRMVLLLENKKLAKELGRQGKILARSSFTLEKMIDKLEIIYDNLIKKSFVETEIVVPKKLLPTPQTAHLKAATLNE
jgi:1,2-diacylglycerol 3-alpha-glucosyltransferase